MYNFMCDQIYQKELAISMHTMVRYTFYHYLITMVINYKYTDTGILFPILIIFCQNL